MFRDVTSVMQDPEGLQLAIKGLNDLVKDVDYDVVVGPESRGFISEHLSLMLTIRRLYL